MNINRFPVLFDIALRGHILNPFWWERSKRHKRRVDVLVSAITKYFKRYLPKTGQIPEQKIIKDDKNDKIFSIWLQGEENAPDLVKACFRSIRRNCSQELIVLDENSVFDYISLPDVIVQKYKDGKIHRAHFADICRVELLYEHGGYWLDSTDFMMTKMPDWIEKQDFFMFLTGTKYGSPYSFTQNCFIRARKGSYLLAAWRQTILNYWIKENREFDYFMHQLLYKTLVTYDKRAKEYFEKMPHISQDPTHVLWAEYRNKPFNQAEFDKMAKDACFQKLTYRGSDNLVPRSFADVMVHKM